MHPWEDIDILQGQILEYFDPSHVEIYGDTVTETLLKIFEERGIPVKALRNVSVPLQQGDVDIYCQSWVIWYAYLRTAVGCSAKTIVEQTLALSPSLRLSMIKSFWQDLYAGKGPLLGLRCESLFS